MRGAFAEHEVDSLKLWVYLNAERDKMRVSFRTVAMLAGVSASSITRLKAGKKPDCDGFMRLCAWMLADPRFFFRAPAAHLNYRTPT